MQMLAINRFKKPFLTKEWIYVLYLSFLCMMFLLRDVLSISVPLVVFILYFAGGFVLFDYDHFLALTAMMPLLGHGVQTNYVILVAIVVYLVKYGKGMVLTIPMMIVGFLMMFELIHVAGADDSVVEFLRYAVQYAFIGIILGEARIKKLIKRPMVVLKTFLFMAVYFMIDVLLVTLKYVPIAKIFSTENRFGSLTDFIGLTPSLGDNQNMVALFAIVAICIALVGMFHEKKHYVTYGLLIAYFSFFGLLTASKTFIVCWVLFAIILVFYLCKKSIWKAAIVIVICGVLIVVIGKTLLSDLFDSVLARFDVADITTGRSALLKMYNEFITSDISNMLFGIGLQSVDIKTGIANTPHNAIQEIILCWGLVGLILVFALCWKLVRQYRRIEKKGRFIYILPFLMFVVFIQTIQFVRLSAIFGLLVLFYVVILVGGAKDEQKDVSNNG